MAAIKLVVALLMVGLALGQKNCDKPCPRSYFPLCGTDGKTHGNKCEFEVAQCKDSGLDLAYKGECKKEKECSKPCFKIYRPVCGSDGKTYGNKCGLENAQCKDQTLKLAYDGACKETPGFCPKPLIFSHCGYLCDKDSDCRKGEKCCSNGCGRGCMTACKQLRCSSCPKGTKAKTDANNCPTCRCEDCKKVPFYCSEKCEHGYRVDQQGCTQCDCKPKCEEVSRCKILCPSGYMRDQNGCKTCQCRSRAPCPRVTCRSPCIIKRGFGGCPVCDCKKIDIVRCPKVSCPADCAYIKDGKGCLKCNCTDDCPTLSCKEKCDYGQKVDAHGCLTCDCLKPLGCRPPIPCPRMCGFSKDKYGCMKCKCNFGCPIPTCSNRCDSGYKPDSQGCMTCECIDREEACPRPLCMRGCKIVRGSNGCPTCQCLGLKV